jgi:hypothetical protein
MVRSNDMPMDGKIDLNPETRGLFMAVLCTIDSPHRSRLFPVSLFSTTLIATVVLQLFVFSTTLSAQWSQVTSKDALCLVSSGSYLYAGMSEGGVYRSSDGSTWTRVGSTSDPLYTDAIAVNALHINSSYVYAGTQGHGLFRSSDNGANWDSASTGLPNGVSITSLLSKGTTFFAGTSGNGMYVSSDGTNWSASNTGFSSTSTIKAMVLSNSTVIISTEDDGVYSSVNNGSSWTAVSNTSGLPSDISINAFTTNGSNVYAGTNGNSIYFSSDNGKNWDELDSGLTSSTVVYSLLTVASDVFCGTEGNVYHYRGIWSTVNSGLSDKSIVSLVSSGNYLYAGTDNGIWKSILPPVSPSSFVPSTNSTNQSIDSLTISWNTVDRVTSYGLQISTDSTFKSSVFYSKSGLTSASQLIDGLLNNTVYYWRVNATNIGGTSSWSTVCKFSTTLLSPTQVSPVNNANDQATTLAFSWTTVSSATSYSLQVGTDSSFSTSLAFSQSGLTATSQSVSSLANNTVYYWRVSATNSGGTSEWSNAFKFSTIIAAPASPQLTQPANNASGQAASVSLKWNTVTTAATYSLQVGIDSLFTTGTIIYSQSDLTAISQTVSGLSNNTMYYWRVNASNGSGTGPWSSTYRFTTIIGTPTLLSPANNALNQDTSLTLSWNAISYATSYSLRVSTDSTFASTSSDIVNQSGITTTSRLVSGLSASTIYYWRVNATNTGGTGAWSTVYHFTTRISTPAAPTLTTPLNKAVNEPLSLPLEWSSVTSATSYSLQVSSDSLFTSSFIANLTGLTTTTQSISGLANNTQYYWRVRAVNSSGTGAWSTVFYFATVIAAPVLSLPVNNALSQDTSLTVTWESVTSATSYTLQVSTDSTFASTMFFNQSGITTASQQITKLIRNTIYYWRVNATNNSGSSGWSIVFHLTTRAGVPDAPVPTSPLNNSVNQAVSLSLSWNSSIAATSYTLQVSTDSTFATSIVFNQSSITALTQTVSGLTFNTTYYWRVNGVNSSGKSAWSSIFKFTTTIAVPVLATPLNSATGQAISLTLSWNTATSATSYTLQVSTDATFDSPSAMFFNQSALTTTSQLISDLSNNTVYYWRVNASNNNGSGAWSTVFHFTTIAVIPETPDLSSPLNDAVNQALSLSVSWSSISTATSYSLQVSADSTFATTFISNQTGLTAGSQSISGLSNNTIYYWRVRAVNSSGASAWSTVFHFTTLLASPVLVSPVNAATAQDTLPSVIWKKVTSATSYTVQVSTDAAFSSYTFNSSGIVDTTTKITSLSSNTTYYWRVNATNASGTSAWSTVNQFTTLVAAPLDPVLSAPINNAVNQALSLSLAWGKVSSATSYTLEVSADSNFTSTIVSLTGITATTQVISGISNSTVYYWRVKAINASGSSNWSTFFRFTTTLAAPVLTSPTTNATSQAISLLLSWNTVTAATNYTLQVSTDSLFANTSGTAYNQSGLTTTSQTVTDLKNSTVYYWRVNASNANGTGSWSTTYKFTTIVVTPDVPVSVSPVHEAVNQALSLSFTWNSVSSASSYSLQVSTDSTFTASLIINQSGLTSLTQTISGLTNNTIYFWRIRATNAAGNSSWSAVFKFTTTLAAPILSLPAKNATNQAISLTMSWNAVSSAISYTLQVATDSSFANTIGLFFNQSGLTSTSQSISDLENGTIYYWRVNATNASGTSVWSTVFKFGTILEVSDVPVLASPLNNAVNTALSVSLTWSSVTSAASYTVQVSTDSTFATSIIVNRTGVTGLAQTISGLAYNTVYFWRANATNSAGTSAWSSVYKFTTTLAVPVLSSPVTNATGQSISPILSWGAVTSATSYTLQVATDSSFASTAFNQNGLTTTSQTVPGLKNGITYYWRVNATNGTGTSEWATIFRFTTIIGVPDAPALASPLNNAVNQERALSLTWSAVTSAVSYSLQVSTDSTFATATVVNQTGLAGLTQAVSGLAYSTIYYWRVNATNATGTGAWSPTYTFTTTLSLPVLSLPTNNSTSQDTALTLTWTAVATATSYTVQVAKDSSFASSSTIVFNQSGIITVSQTIADLSCGTAYYWRVNASNTGGTGAWSATSKFITRTGVPSAPVPALPLNAAVNQAISLSLSWNSTAGATSYTFQLATDSAFTTSSIITNQTGLTAVAQSVTGLSYNTTYYWRVNANNSAGQGPWSTMPYFTTTLPSPNLSTPLTGTANLSTTTAAAFTWTGVASATSYALQISTDSTFSKTIVYSQSGIDTTFHTVTTLSNSTKYYWRVNATNAGGTSAWSTVYRFTTIVATPPAPVLSTPLSGATDQLLTQTLIWTVQALATSYALQVSIDSTFESSIIVNQTGITAIAYNLSGLSYNTTYYWRVNGVNTAGSGLWSSVNSFKTVIKATELVSPANDEVSQPLTVTCEWRSDSLATSYTLQICAGDSSFITTPIFNQNGLTSTSQTITDLSNNTTYYWRIKSSSANGNSIWTTPYHFTTAIKAPAPTSPVDLANNQALSVKLIWGGITTALSYTLQVSSDSTFSKSLVCNQSGITALTQTISGLSYATTYYWRVKAANAKGSSLWSSVNRFSTLMPSPELSFPADEATSQQTTVTFEWKADSSATSYVLQIATNDSTFTKSFYNQSELASMMHTVTDFEFNTKYYWRVKSSNSAGTSDWSAANYFTTKIDAPELVTPANAVTNQALIIKFTWNAVSKNATYTLQVATDSTFTTALMFNQSAISITSQTVSGLNNSTKYYWRVLAVSSDGTTTASSTIYFKTLLAAPVLVTPTTAAIDQATDMTFTWDTVPGAASYSLQLSTNSAFASFVYNQSGLTTASQRIITLSYNTRYYWRVNATNAGGTSAWSTANYFNTTALPTPTLVAPVSNAENLSVSSPDFVWNRIAAASTYILQISTDSLFKSSSEVYEDSLTDTLLTITSLSNSETYYWHVRACSNSGMSSWSDRSRFSTEADDDDSGQCGVGSLFSFIPPIFWKVLNINKKVRKNGRCNQNRH